MGLEALLRGWVSRQQPQAETDNDPGVLRLGRYGEAYIVPLVRKQAALADEGSYFVANNGQTPVAGPTAAAAFTAISPAYAIVNTDSPTNGNAKRIHLDYLNLTPTTAMSAASTGLAKVCAVVIDTSARILTSTPVTMTPINPNMDVSKQASVAQVYGGAVVAAAATNSARTAVGARVMRLAVSATAAELIWETQYVNFGGVEGPPGGITGSTGALGANGVFSSINLPPIVIGPGQVALFYFWFQGATTPAAGSYLPEFGWWER
jgi:hypothetical protein